MLCMCLCCSVFFSSASCLLQEQRRAMQPAGRGGERNEAYPTGVFGRQTFLGGWRSCKPRQLTTGCKIWLVPSGLTSLSVASWATIVPSLTLNLRSEAEQRREI
ncbi:hypothetical protein FQN60_001187 [Etheostoma spectabile]|uniref:Secreted protein n=1 Tax=Etheostoma spectabile TaxID=54343 RepID=A0A5J5D4F2_9PERO|nr:hypothetical protein FQN60_001187 [Etheostoma spectabile]